MKFYCYDCASEYEVDENNLIPARGWNIVDEEYLLFYCICPKCMSISTFEECTSTDKELIPPDMKLRLMKKYSLVSDDYIEYYKQLKEYEVAKRKCEKIFKKIKLKEKNRSDNSCLYENWKTSEEIVSDVAKLELK